MNVAASSDTADFKAATERLLMPTYGRNPVKLVRGEGMHLWDSEGKQYLDFLSGIAVVSIGHCHPAVTEAVSTQVAQLVHVTNLFYTDAQLELAERIQAIEGWGKTFFSNSGAEANECALKLIRLYAGGPLGLPPGSQPRVIALEGSFHGRTFGSLSMTGQFSKQDPFRPMLPGFEFVPVNDVDALETALPGAGALVVEVIQGEGGVIPIEIDYLKRAREFCDETGALLVVDEVQTGLCRTGAWLASDLAGIQPDIYTLGKALGNGLPIAATVARPEIADLFSPGDHGSTMGGGPVVCRAATAVLDVMRNERLDEAATTRGIEFAGLLSQVDGVVDVRGGGLLVAAEIEADASAVAAAALERGLIVNAVTPTAIRFTPPLVVSSNQISEAVAIFSEALEVVRK